MNFKTFLEAFDSDVKARITKDTPAVFNVESLINDQKVRFSAMMFGDEWEAVFETHNGKGYTYNKTNSSGDNPKQAMQVFAFVMECLKELVKRKDPRVVEFSSEKSDGNRTSVYTRLSKRYTPAGYSLSIKSGGHKDMFTFTKTE